MSDCEHVSLTKCIVGETVYYRCLYCNQKFKAKKWDGRFEARKPPLEGLRGFPKDHVAEGST